MERLKIKEVKIDDMEKIELLLNTFKGDNNERSLYSFWKHFPHDDLDPKRLANAHLNFYSKYDFDLMKISPHGRYANIPFGCTIAKGYDPISGSTNCETCVIQSISDWEEVEPVSVTEGEFGKQLKTIELITKKVETTVPKMMTIFSPLMVASKMTEDLVSHLREKPDTVIEALFILEKVMTEFALASLESGAEGLFIASQHIRKTELTLNEVKRFEFAFLKRILNKLNHKALFTVLHMHGDTSLYFEESIEELQIDAINWHDQLVQPNLVEGGKLFKGGLFGGINEIKLLEMKKEQSHVLRENILDVLSQSFNQLNNRVILSPGCVIPLNTQDYLLETIKTTIHEFNKER